MMSTTHFIAAIELGSSKIAGIVGKKNGDGSIQILAHAKEESSSFIRKGVIFNLDKTAQSLTSIINKLESSLNCSIGKVYVGISGQSMHTVKNTIARDLKDETIISQELIDSICDENRSATFNDMEILDVAPQEYKVGNTFQAEPVGVPASYVEGHFMNIVARTALKKNLEHCFELAQIKIADIFISPLITAEAVLTESEMRSGCVLVDFGADTTTVTVYKGNILRFISVLPLGGNNITHDITSLHMEEHEAEALKIKYGDAQFELDEGAEETIVHSDSSQVTTGISKLNDIIGARAEEIVANVRHQIHLSGYEDKLLSGIVITGGGINLKHIDKLLNPKGSSDKVRIAATPNFEVKASGDILLKNGTQNTLFGLISAGEENCYEPKKVEGPAIQEELFSNDQILIQQQEKALEDKKKREEEEKKRREEERKRRKEEKKNKPSWFKSTFEKLSNEIFSDEDMK